MTSARKPIIVKTRFNKSGRRRLVPPLDDTKVCAPASRLWRWRVDEARRRRDATYKSALCKYRSDVEAFIARYVNDPETSTDERSSIVRFLARRGIHENSPLHPEDTHHRRAFLTPVLSIEPLMAFLYEAKAEYSKRTGEADRDLEAARREARLEAWKFGRHLWDEVWVAMDLKVFRHPNLEPFSPPQFPVKNRSPRPRAAS